MAIDAFLTVLGPARVQRWMCESQEAYERARQEEQIFIEGLEQQLTLQLRQRVIFTSSLVPERMTAKQLEGSSLAEENTVEPRLFLQIGHDDGLAPLQGSILAAVLDQPFKADALLDDPTAPRRQAQTIGFSGVLTTYRHLLDHHPKSGLYLPKVFPRPLELPHRGDLISVGSLEHVQTELESWRHHVLPYLETTLFSTPEWIVTHVDNLTKMVKLALVRGVALELF